MELEAAFLTEITSRLRYYKTLGDKTLTQLSDADILFKPSGESNSIAIIVQHLYGNMMSRFTDMLTTDGEKEWRKRDAEFEPMDLTKQDVTDLWETGWSRVFATIHALTKDDLMKEISIRSVKLTVFDALLRQLAHYPYHIGQIILIAKMIKDKDWQNLSIAKGESKVYEQGVKEGSIDPEHASGKA